MIRKPEQLVEEMRKLQKQHPGSRVRVSQGGFMQGHAYYLRVDRKIVEQVDFKALDTSALFYYCRTFMLKAAER